MLTLTPKGTQIKNQYEYTILANAGNDYAFLSGPI